MSHLILSYQSSWNPLVLYTMALEDLLDALLAQINEEEKVNSTILGNILSLLRRYIDQLKIISSLLSL